VIKQVAKSERACNKRPTILCTIYLSFQCDGVSGADAIRMAVFDGNSEKQIIKLTDGRNLPSTNAIADVFMRISGWKGATQDGGLVFVLA
jgi:hypothetical protein